MSCFQLAHLEVFRQQQLAGAQEAEDVAEDVSVSVDEVVLLQTVQHDGLGAVEQATDPAESRTTGSHATGEPRCRPGSHDPSSLCPLF